MLLLSQTLTQWEASDSCGTLIFPELKRETSTIFRVKKSQSSNSCRDAAGSSLRRSENPPNSLHLKCFSIQSHPKHSHDRMIHNQQSQSQNQSIVSGCSKIPRTLGSCSGCTRRPAWSTHSFVKTDHRPQAAPQRAAAAQAATEKPFYTDGEVLP